MDAHKPATMPKTEGLFPYEPTQTSIQNWFIAHAEQDIEVAQKGTVLKVTGRCEHPEEIDACSTTMFTTRFYTHGEQIDIALSFHATALSMHINIKDEALRLAGSFPLHIPYEHLQLSVL